ALDTSMLFIRACGTGLRNSLANSMRGRMMSSANLVWPVHFDRASTFRKGLPITLYGFPFLSLLSLILLKCPLSVVRCQLLRKCQWSVVSCQLPPGCARTLSSFYWPPTTDH